MGRCGRTEREAAGTTYREYRLLVEGKDAQERERYELARWLAYRIYAQNPYIKPPKAGSVKAYFRFPWEEPTEEEATQAAKDCKVSKEEAAILDRIFEEIEKKRGTVQ